MFKKGEVVSNRGVHITAEQRAKIIQDRKAGKKWREIAEELGVPTKRAMTWAKRAWYKNGMSKTDEVKTEEPIVKKIKTDSEGTTTLVDPKKDESKTKDTVVEKVKDKAAKTVDAAVTNHIKKSDKAPKSISRVEEKGKDTDGVDKVSKKGLSAPKTVGMWFLLAIILAVIVIFVVFLLLKPKPEEKAEHGKPTKEKPSGFEGRSIEDL